MAPAPPARACPLPDLRLLRVAGADRVPFLQGQLTQDVTTVSPARGAAFGWATAQGRLLVTGQLVDDGTDLWLAVPAALAAAIARRLSMFVLRARVSVAVSERAVIGVFAGGAALALPGLQLPATDLACAAGAAGFAARLAGDATRALWVPDPGAAGATPAAAGLGAADAADWARADVAAGIPVLGPATSEAFVPQMVNLDLLGGIAFAKGCYAGQEIVTRTRHLGRIKRRLLRYAAEGIAPPAPGSALHGAERPAGTVVNAVAVPGGAELLAVVQLDELAGGLFADAERTVALRRLALPYPVPEA